MRRRFPAVYGRAVAANIDRRNDPVGETSDDCRGERRIREGASDVDRIGSGDQRGFDRSGGAETAAEVNAHSVTLQSRQDVRVNRTTVFGPFEVDDVNAFGARLPETEGRFFRSVGKHGRIGEFAFPQPDDVALVEIDGRQKDHATLSSPDTPPAFSSPAMTEARSRNPTGPLRSG